MKKILLSALIMAGTAATFAQVPGTLSYQGILVKTSPPADAGKPVDDGVHFVRFLFFNVPVGGTPVYSSLGTGSGNTVTTYKGMFSFVIGSGSPGNDPIPAGIFNEQLYVEVVADGVTLTPRIPLTTTPYTFRAQTVNAVDASAITAGTIADARLSTHLQDLADGTLTGSKVGTGINAANITTGALAVANGGTGATTAAAARTNLGLGSLSTLSSVGSSEITDGSVASADLADNSVTSAKIADGTIAAADLSSMAASSGQVLKYTGTAWAPGTDFTGISTTLNSGNILVGNASNVATAVSMSGDATISNTGAVTIANNAITTAKMADASVSTVKLADNSVTSAKIADGTIATTDLADASVSAVKLADNSVTSAKIADGTIATTDLADASVSAVKLADNSVTSAKIADGTIATADIADGAITAAKLAAGSTLTGSGTANRVAFWTGASALSSNNNLVWDNSTSRLGIGTTTPAAALDVNGASIFRGFTGINRLSPIGLSNFVVEGTAAANTYMGMFTNGTDPSSWPFYGYATAGSARMWHYYNGATGSWILNNNGDRLAVLNNGFVGIGTTTPTRTLEVVTPNSSTSATGFYVLNDYNGTATKNGITVDVTSSGTGTSYGIDVNVTGGASTSTSVYGLETDVTPNGSGTAYGINSVVSAVGTGTRYGVYSEVRGAATNSSNIYGNYNFAQKLPGSTGNLYGYFGLIYHDGTGTSYGIYLNNAGGSAGPRYGLYTTNETANYMFGPLGLGIPTPAFKIDLPNIASDIGGRGRANSWVTYSDNRVKSNQKPLNYGLKEVMLLNPKRYTHHSSIFETGELKLLEGTPTLGLIAQEVYTLIPEVVSKPTDEAKDLWSLDYTKLVPVLIKAIQEQQATINDQNTTLAQIRAELAELRKMVMAPKPNAVTETSASIGKE